MSDAHRDEIAKLEALYAEHPEGRIFTHLAEAYRKAGELDRAREVLDEGIGRHPDYSSAHVVLGRVLVDQGHTTEAEAEFRRVLELDGQNLVALRSLGDLARADGRREDALEHYRSLLDVEPADDEVRELIEATERGEGLGPGPEAGEPGEDEPPTPGDFGDALTADEPDHVEVVEVEGDLEPAGLEGGGAFVGGPADEAGTDEPGWRTGGETAEAGAGADGDWLGGMPEVEPEDEGGEWVGDVSELAGGSPYETGDGSGEVGGDGEGAGVPDAESPAVEPLAGLEASETETGEADTVEGPGVEGLEGATEAWAGGGASDAGFDAAPEPWGEEATDAPPAGFEAGADGASEPQEEPETAPPHAGRPGVTTETIAHVYARQGLYDRAAEVYRELVRERPEDEGLRQRLDEMERLAAQVADAGAAPAASEDEPVGAYGLAPPPEADPTPLPGFESGEVDVGDAEAQTLEGMESQEIDPETGLAADVGDPAPPAEPAGVGDVRDVPAPPEVEAADGGDADLDEAAGYGDAAEVHPLASLDEDAFGGSREDAPEPWAEEPAESEGAEADRVEAEPAAEGAAGAGEEEQDAEEASVWTGDDWGETDRETPYAWAEEEPVEADAGEPIDRYFHGLLGWSKGRPGAPAEAGSDAGPAEGADDASGTTAPEGAAEAGSTAGSADAADADGEAGPGPGGGSSDDDEDLDMFRSWLESLKQ